MKNVLLSRTNEQIKLTSELVGPNKVFRHTGLTGLASQGSSVGCRTSPGPPAGGTGSRQWKHAQMPENEKKKKL